MPRPAVHRHAAWRRRPRTIRTNAPIDFGADNIELQDKANRAVLSGSVSVKQAEMTLNAARMTVSYTGQVVGGNPQVSRLDASGGVTVRRPDQTAKSQFAIYDLNRRVITMLGAVTLTQGGNTVNGGRLTINLDTGRAVIDGSSVRGSSGATGGTHHGGAGRPRHRDLLRPEARLILFPPPLPIPRRRGSGRADHRLSHDVSVYGSLPARG